MLGSSGRSEQAHPSIKGWHHRRLSAHQSRPSRQSRRTPTPTPKQHAQRNCRSPLTRAPAHTRPPCTTPAGTAGPPWRACAARCAAAPSSARRSGRGPAGVMEAGGVQAVWGKDGQRRVRTSTSTCVRLKAGKEGWEQKHEPARGGQGGGAPDAPAVQLTLAAGRCLPAVHAPSQPSRQERAPTAGCQQRSTVQHALVKRRTSKEIAHPQLAAGEEAGELDLAVHRQQGQHAAVAQQAQQALLVVEVPTRLHERHLVWVGGQGGLGCKRARARRAPRCGWP